MAGQSINDLVSDIVSEWRLVHDYIFRPTLILSIRRVIPLPFVFAPIRYGQCADDLVDIMQKFCVLQAHDDAVCLGANGEEATIGSVKLVGEAILTLLRISSKLNEKSQGKSGYAISDYNNDISYYEDLLARLKLADLGGHFANF